MKNFQWLRTRWRNKSDFALLHWPLPLAQTEIPEIKTIVPVNFHRELWGKTVAQPAMVATVMAQTLIDTEVLGDKATQPWLH